MESFRKTKLIHPAGRESRGLFAIDRVTPDIGWGGGFEQGLGSFKIAGSKNHKAVPLYYKEMRNARELKDYIAFYQRSKEIGLPVPPTMRARRWDRVVMTDYHSLGVVFFGKAMLNSMIDYDTVPRARGRISAIPKYALEGFAAACENLDVIERETRNYCEIATKHRLLLPFDEKFELGIYPDGSWKMILLDLHFGAVNCLRARVREENERFASRTISGLESMQNWLEEHRFALCPPESYPEPVVIQPREPWWQRLGQRVPAFKTALGLPKA